MRTIPVTAIILLFISAGCDSTRVAYQPYRDAPTDTGYIGGRIENTPDKQVILFGYQTSVAEISDRSNNEDIKRLGLILPAKSILTDKMLVRKTVSNGADTCGISFHKTINQVRNGRSALASVDNLVSSVKGEPTNPQPEPSVDLSSVEAEGEIVVNGKNSPFYFRHNYDYIKNTIYTGWLVMGQDTLSCKQIRDTRQTNQSWSKPYWEYDYWVEILRNGNAVAAVQLHLRSYGRVYLSKALSREEKLICIAFFLSIYNL